MEADDGLVPESGTYRFQLELNALGIAGPALVLRTHDMQERESRVELIRHRRRACRHSQRVPRRVCRAKHPRFHRDPGTGLARSGVQPRFEQTGWVRMIGRIFAPEKPRAGRLPVQIAWIAHLGSPTDFSMSCLAEDHTPNNLKEPNVHF